MLDITKVKELLAKIQRTRATEREATIDQFLDMVWAEDDDGQDDTLSMLAELATDLTFYESDERDRDETLGYYGENELQLKINEALKKL